VNTVASSTSLYSHISDFFLLFGSGCKLRSSLNNFALETFKILPLLCIKLTLFYFSAILQRFNKVTLLVWTRDSRVGGGTALKAGRWRV